MGGRQGGRWPQPQAVSKGGISWLPGLHFLLCNTWGLQAGLRALTWGRESHSWSGAGEQVVRPPASGRAMPAVGQMAARPADAACRVLPPSSTRPQVSTIG